MKKHMEVLRGDSENLKGLKDDYEDNIKAIDSDIAEFKDDPDMPDKWKDSLEKEKITFKNKGLDKLTKDMGKLQELMEFGERKINGGDSSSQESEIDKGYDSGYAEEFDS